MKIVTISGLDGSGKSTQIKMLKRHLEQKGSKIFYFHAIKFSLAQKLVDFKKKYCLICKIKKYCKIKPEKTKGVTKASPFRIFLRKIFLRIDIWRFGLLLNKLSNKNYDYILSDRYFYDTIINIKYLSLLTSDVRNFLTSDVRKPDFAIYLQTNPEVIMQRKRVPDQGIDYLKKKKELYDASVSAWDMRIINGNRSKEEVFEEIRLRLTEISNTSI